MKSILCFAVVLITLLPFSTVLSQKNSYEYAFVTWEEGKNIDIWSVNKWAQKNHLLCLTFPEGFSVLDPRLQRLVSPDGKYLALRFRDETYPTKNLIQLVEINTGEILRVAETPFGQPRMSDYEPILPVWSPDSRHIAFSAWAEGEETDVPYIYMYHLNTYIGKRIPTLGYPIALAWSTDSMKLAVASSICSFTSCDFFMEIISISEPASGFWVEISGNDVPCRLKWSNNNNFISYIKSCSIDSVFSHDIYIYDITEESTLSVTSFTESSAELFKSRYDLIWYDQENLFIGASVKKMTPEFDPDASFIGTISYQLSEASLLPLASDVFSEWSINPLTKEVAFRAENMVNFETVGASVRSARFDGQNLVTMWETPAGCNLQWSPDGDVLAYENRSSEEEKCLPYGEVKGIILVQRDTGEFREYLFPFAEDINVSAAGWVLVP